MMYSNNFAAAILVNGKVLREFGDTVYLPFGSEYKIRLKNLGSTRAKVGIEIDGNPVTDGGLVIPSLQTVDLERFIKDGNKDAGNRFKFIERSAKVEKHRGLKVEDGIITIRYDFEMVPIAICNTPRTHYEPELYDRARLNTTSVISEKGNHYLNRTGDMLRARAAGQEQLEDEILSELDCAWVDMASSDRQAAKNVSRAYCSASPLNAKSVNQTGITVEGSLSDQKFTSTHWRGSIGGTNILNIRLLGETEDNNPVHQPVTVKTKAKCKTCGTLNKATAKFCAECGTSLQII